MKLETLVEAADDAAAFANNIEGQFPGVRIDMFSVRDDIELSAIVIPKEIRGEGVGSRIMQMITDYADENNRTIRLTPDKSYGATSVQRLKRFYKRFGFVENKGRNKNYRIMNSMYRRPERTRL